MLKKKILLILIPFSLVGMDKNIEISECEGQASILNRDLAEFKQIVQENIEIIDLCDELGGTLLSNAIALKKYDYAKVLCGLQASPWASNTEVGHVVHQIAQCGDIKALRLILKYFSDSPVWEYMRMRHNSNDPNYNSALAHAQKNGHDVFAFILKNFHKYNNPLTKAIVFGDIDALCAIVNHIRSRTPLKDLLFDGISKVVDQKLTASNLDDPERSKFYCTPLTFAVLLHDYEIVKYLLEQGARNIGSFITKHLAKDVPDIIKNILEKYHVQLIPDVKCYPINSDKQMALSNAVIAEDEDTVRAILKSGAKINGLDYKGNTALHWACTTGSPDMIALLLQLGAKPNISSIGKTRTGLHWLLRMHKSSVEKHGTQIATSVFLSCLYVLMSHGADPEIEDAQGKTFIDWLEAQFKETDKELVYKVLAVRKLSAAERLTLLEDIFNFQMRQMNKWHLNSSNFNLIDVAHIRAICVKQSESSLGFKEIYTRYAIDGNLGVDPRFIFEDRLMSLIDLGDDEDLMDFLEANLGKSINLRHHRLRVFILEYAQTLNNQKIIGILQAHQIATEKYQDQLFIAIEHDDLKILLDFLDDHKEHDKDFLHYEYMKTPLEYAVELGHLNRVRALIEVGAKLDQGVHTRPLLLIALMNQDYDMIYYLAQFNNYDDHDIDGIDINFHNSEFFWPPQYPEGTVIPDMRRELYRLFDSRVYRRCLPQDELSKASMIGRIQLIDRAISKGAKINAWDKKGDTALNQACSKARFTSIAHLIDKGANVNLQDKSKGRSALHWVVRMHNKAKQKGARYMSSSELLSCSFLLMCAGADPRLKDKAGKSVLYWVEALSINEEEKILLRRILNIPQLTRNQRLVLLSNIYTFQVNELHEYIACEKIPVPLSLGARYFWHRPECIRMKNAWVREDNDHLIYTLVARIPNFKDIYTKYL